MTNHRFFRYDLRTTDPDAARAFYAEVVGLDLPAGQSAQEPAIAAAWPLHEQARARGAPPHWLGAIGVADVEATVDRLVQLGSERLGPTVRTSDGTLYATLRDPSGAVVSVRATATLQGAAVASGPVAWHHLHTKDLDRAWAQYTELFGWAATDTFDAADLVGGYRMFAWDGSGGSAGSMANTARWPGVHPHWQFYFRVADLEASLAKVQALGGLVVRPPARLPNGDLLVPCDDPQGAAFGLFQSSARP
jgi:predicted enzyme related to lactoylglutathione lyase